MTNVSFDRHVLPSGEIESVSEFQAYGSRSGAHAAARRLSQA